MDKQLKIGILGGIGPYASAIFYKRLITAIQESGIVKSNHDYPQIVINSIPAPEIFFGTETDNDLSEYIEGLKLLDSLNPDFILMVCNTIYLYLPELQKQIKTPILDLIEIVNKKIKTMGVQRLAILGSKSSMKMHLYGHNVEHVDISQQDQDQIVDLINSINLGNDIELGKEKLKGVVCKYLDAGADAVLMGCTELDTVSRQNAMIISPMDIIIEHILLLLERNK